MSALHPAERLASAIGRMLDRRVTRRSALSKAALAGSAFAVAPARYLIRPGTAWAVIGPGDCHSIRSAGMATRRSAARSSTAATTARRARTWPAGGSAPPIRDAGLCADEGVRYYIDCNRIPGHVFPGGCQCARGDCNRRCVDCNHFRYGQCNTQISGTTEVVCRLVICHHPASVAGMNSNATEKVDDKTCEHEAEMPRGARCPATGRSGRMIVALVSVETVLLVLLVILVAGLLRSHAAIMRRLGPGDEPLAPVPPMPVSQAPAAASGATGEPAPLAGVTPGGDAVGLAFTAGAPTLLAFLTSGCSSCAEFSGLAGRAPAPGGRTHRDRRPRPRPRAPGQAPRTRAHRDSRW